MEFSRILVLVSLLGMMVDTGMAAAPVSAAESQPASPQTSSRARRTSGGALIFNISLSLLNPPSEDLVGICYGGSTAGLGDTSLRLEHRSQAEGDNEPWVVERRNISQEEFEVLQFSIDAQT